MSRAVALCAGMRVRLGDFLSQGSSFERASPCRSKQDPRRPAINAAASRRDGALYADVAYNNLSVEAAIVGLTFENGHRLVLDVNLPFDKAAIFVLAVAIQTELMARISFWFSFD